MTMTMTNVYTPQIMFLLAFSFANFEKLKSNFFWAVFLSALPLVVSKFAKEKARRYIFWGVYLLSDMINIKNISYKQLLADIETTKGITSGELV